MKKAIISDVHSNWEALQAVLNDIVKERADQIYCLGDMVGYGPNPREVVDLLMDLELPVILMGNHDEAVYGNPVGFNRTAERALRWTREQLNVPQQSQEYADRRRQFLATRPQKHVEDDFLFVHASPRDPLNEYVHPEHARDIAKMSVLFWMVSRACFMGHTHVPGIFTQDCHFFSPDEVAGSFRLANQKIMCNVGSVGQPRDGDMRASYVILDDDTIIFRRVPYDVAALKKKVKAVRELDFSMWT